MFHYEVWVASQKFHAQRCLTYSSPNRLAIGQLVQVPVRNNLMMGFVEKPATVDPKLAGKIKPVTQVFDIELPAALRKLHQWLQNYYPGPSGTITNLFLPSEPSKQKTIKIEETDAQAITLPPLTPEQRQALEQLTSSNVQTALIHGDTGTGKTRIYTELAQKALDNGKSVIMLTPEIGLTPQLVRSFSELFPRKVVVLHSNLTPAQRRDSWYKIAGSHEPLVIIGPRSALFAPLKDVGVVIVDEAHEHTYKQEQAPYYHASRVAAQLSRIHGALCVFGTATPLVSDYYLFDAKKMPIIRLTQPAKRVTEVPASKVVNLRDPDEMRGSTILSKSLRAEIEKYVGQGQQALLFLNRRGSARMVLCQNCGWQAVCPNCDISLTYHGDQHKLLCHTCGFSQAIVTACPVCSSSDILYQTPGTKSLEHEVKHLFPELRVQRFDSDNLADEKLEKHFVALVNGEIDIIIGTQLVTKGLDLPNLGVVGIINADASLSFPDYTAEEKTYQLLTQVIGRVGRHHKPTSIVIQTYNPDNPLLQIALTKDWQRFYEQQIKERQQFGFPPFYHLLQLKIARASRASAETAGNKLVEQLRALGGVHLRGPSPQLHEKIRGKYHWQVVVAAKERQKLLDVIANLPSGWQHNIDPVDLM